MLAVQHCETLCSKCDVTLKYFFHSFLLLICVWRCLKAEITTRFVIRQNNNKMFWNSRFFNRFLEAWSGLDFIASTMKQVRSFQFREYKSKFFNTVYNVLDPTGTNELNPWDNSKLYHKSFGTNCERGLLNAESKTVSHEVVYYCTWLGLEHGY